MAVERSDDLTVALFQGLTPMRPTTASRTMMIARLIGRFSTFCPCLLLPTPIIQAGRKGKGKRRRAARTAIRRGRTLIEADV
jgi:hypothetical protein